MKCVMCMGMLAGREKEEEEEEEEEKRKKNVYSFKPPHLLWNPSITHDCFQRGKPMDCTDEILVFFGISLVL